MKMMRTSIAALTIVLAGCAGGPRLSEIKQGIAPIPDGQGRVYFYRSSSMLGAAIQPNISMNGTIVGTSKPGGFFYADVPAGNVKVAASTEVEKQLTFTIESKETRYVKTSPSLGVFVGRVVPELISEAEATKDLAELHYIGK
jgi:hypothetical protein